MVDSFLCLAYMSRMEITLPVCTCLRCGHSWVPRKPERPMTCANCRSPYWDKPRQREADAVSES